MLDVYIEVQGKGVFLMENYKLLLVDDEEEVRNAILKKIQWEQYGFEVIGAVENGKEALDIAEKITPDVVMTDIKMPFMDGMQLSAVIREKYPTTKIIVLTGFDEFEYAQKAIKLNVMEYLLKPISASELVEVLIKVKAQFDKEIEEKKDIQYLREYYRKSIPILKEKFLTSIVTSILEKEEIEEKCKNYNISLAGNFFAAVIINIDSNTPILKSIDMEQSKAAYTELYDDKELLKFAVLNIAEEIVDKYELGITFLNNDEIVFIAVAKSKEKIEFIKLVFELLEELRQNVQRFLKVSLTIGIGNICSEATAINLSYKNALTALDYRLFMGNNRSIWIEDIEPKSAGRIIFDEVKEHALTSAIKVGTEEEISSTMNMLFQEISDIRAAIKDYQIYLMEMLTTILKAARNSDVHIDEIFGSNRNLYVELESLRSKEEVLNWFKEISIRTMKHIAKDRQDNCKILVEQAKNFIKENYCKSDISINTVCENIHISPTYFSFIFKRDTKTTFINYLTQVRMEVAKELLRTTNMKAFEVADKVGYADANYFSYSFKKKFGKSPSEYRSSF